MAAKILTLNLRHDLDRWEERFPLIIKMLLTESPDIIALQEVAIPIQQAELIVDMLNTQVDRPYAVFTGQKWGEHLVEGIALLARFPVIAYEHTNLPQTSRLAQRIRVVVDGQTIDVVNTHLHHMPIFEETIRLPQIQHILKWMFERPKAESYRWVLVGDFNALPASSTMQAAREHLTSAIDDVQTVPSPLRAEDYPPGLSVQVDYILYDSNKLNVTHAAVIANQQYTDDPVLYPSDHYGLVAEFNFLD